MKSRLAARASERARRDSNSRVVLSGRTTGREVQASPGAPVGCRRWRSGIRRRGARRWLFERESPDGKRPAEACLDLRVGVATPVWLLRKDADEAGLRVAGDRDALVRTRPGTLHDRRRT